MGDAQAQAHHLVGRQLGTTPALLLIGMVSGIACGAFGTYKQVRKYLKD
jgi:uncharacterized protein YneF (UPF0154 family)